MEQLPAFLDWFDAELASNADSRDRAARLDCQLGSWLSMTGLSAGVPMGASHGIGYVLGAVFDVPHGHTSCIMLPAVMRWNEPANAAKQAAQEALRNAKSDVDLATAQAELAVLAAQLDDLQTEVPQLDEARRGAQAAANEAQASVANARATSRRLRPATVKSAAGLSNCECKPTRCAICSASCKA